MTHIYITLEPDEDGYPPYEAEEIDADEVGVGRYRISGVPVFVYGLACGDVVKVVRVSGDSRLWISEVVEESGHWTARVLPVDAEGLAKAAKVFTDIGCIANPTQFGLVAIDVPSSLESGGVMKTLERGREDGTWDFDLGVTPR